MDRKTELTESQRQEVIDFYVQNKYPMDLLQLGLGDRLQWENGGCEIHWQDLIRSNMSSRCFD